MQTGHFSRSILRDGVLEVDWNVGDVFGVVSMVGAVTTVSLGTGGGWVDSAAWFEAEVVAEVVAGASSFILALDLVGGMYTGRSGQDPGRLNGRGSGPKHQGRLGA